MRISDLLPYLSFFIAICVTGGGAIIFKQSYSKAASEIQDRVIAALKLEIETLNTRIKACQDETARLSSILETIQAALKSKGIHITIDGDMVIIEESESKATVTKRAITVKQQIKED